MCNSNKSGPKWKREFVQDHKFDYVDIDEFYDPSCTTRIGYLFVYLLILKAFSVYVADLWTGVSLLVVGQTISTAAIPPDVSKYIFLGAILISFLLLFWDIRKARNIIASRDISYAFTSVIGNRYYSVKDYKYYCLFCKINKSRKFTDDIAFFVFFTLKGWKRLLLAEAPRQVINVVTLQALVPEWIKKAQNGTPIYNALGKDVVQQIMMGTMAFSFVIFAMSFILVCVAAVMYIPLLCHIRGNLKEYCCHKVDKRISELLRKQARQRVERNQRAGSGGHKKKSKKELIEMETVPQPTLPKVDLETPNHPVSPSSHYAASRPYYYPNDNKLNNMMPSRLMRRNSGSSMSSDQMGLVSNAQAQPWSAQPNYNYQPGYYDTHSTRQHPPSASPQLSASNTYATLPSYHSQPQLPYSQPYQQYPQYPGYQNRY
ncbi:uncharacterized protein BYT42DRAFT_365253 [Radiomyces spectabilis]|uniref:uncharacterized protein n=1 Tax=Radiomyces spectabilis TaxID=64574 RepID=UPI0022207CFD|nr:uncharacterized protein BYT42DRAFT_365253 [Radiomyces spectabilis]KAI8378034.1 hypothetical protein BYT42DRAFT_365253 [Radiomyces spectabilis]